MSKSYTPGLKILENTKIVKERKLPLKGDIKCSLGDKVKNSHIVASTFLPGNIHMVNIANQLNIDPNTIKDYIRVEINQEVKRGDILAENNGLFGFFKTQIESKLDGKISNISKSTGQIMISDPEIPVEINAYIDGSVVEVIKNEGVVIESHGTLIQGIIGVGGEKIGELVLAEDENIDCKGKIVIISKSIDKSQYDIYSSRGAIGIICGGFHYESLSEILGYKLGVAITGTEEIKTTLIVTEGFGEVEMSKKTYDILKKYKSQTASINGATQIRAGVIRPELIIPKERRDENYKEFDEKDLVIKEGSKVRVIRQPYFGVIGTIVSLPKDPVVIESETKARVAEVELNSGERKLVPRANLEIILD